MDPVAADTIAQVVARNATLHDFTFDVTAHIALLTFPWIRFTLSGHGQYTRDGAYTIHFDNVPWFGKGFENMSMASLDPKTWPDAYTITMAPPNGDSRVLSLHDKKHTSLDQTFVTIDRDQAVREILWTYARGGHVRLTITPIVINGYNLPQAEVADIAVHGYHATANATFSNYRVNALLNPGPIVPQAASGESHGRAQEPVVQRRRQ